MLKIYINNEEVIANQNFTIQKHMLNTPSVVLNNVCPKTWCTERDYTTNFYHPLDYSKCKIIDETYHPYDPGTTTTINQSATLTDVDITKSYELTQIEGNTTQANTPTPTSPQPINVVSGRQDIVVCGKNLLNLKDGTYTATDITAVVENGEITLNGTAGANRFVAISLNNNLGLSSNEIITLSMNNAVANNGIQFRINSGGQLDTRLNEINKTQTINTGTYTDLLSISITIRVASGTTLENFKIKPMIEKGSTASEYEEYTGITNEINLGKNLLNMFVSHNAGYTTTIRGVDFTLNEDGSVLINGTNDGTGVSDFYVYGSWGASTTILSTTQICTFSTSSSITNGNINAFIISGSTAVRNLQSTNASGSVPANTNITALLIRVLTSKTIENITLNLQLEAGSQATSYAPYKTPIELCKIGDYKDRIYKSNGTWYIEKNIGKVVLNGSENWNGGTIAGNYLYIYSNAYDSILLPNKSYLGISTYFKVLDQTINTYTPPITTDSMSLGSDTATAGNRIRIKINQTTANTIANFKTWLNSHNTEIYYVLDTPTYTEITDTELISQLNGIELLEGLNNVSVSSGDLPGIITLHYNFKEAYTTEDLLFCGVVKNSGNISLNPREPHYTTLQVLDFKDFLSSGETLDFVIYQKTILEAIQQVIGTIQDYGFVLGNVNILNPNDIIGAYSTKDKTAYDVFNYIADITQSRWTTRMIDENTVAIDFYDPTLMPQGTAIDYTNAFFNDKLIDDMKYSYGTNNYRNKQVMISNQVYSNISQAQTIVANGYQTQFPTEQPIGKINSITSNGVPLTFATFNEKDMGYVADFYYNPGDNYFESDDLRSTGEILIIDYVAIVEGRQVITNASEIDRINESTGRKGIIARYETRNDATTSTELQKIGESYIKYKGTPEIKLTIESRKNTWEVGQRVQFNAPIDELDTEYMVRSKKINYIANQQENQDQLFYTYELISSFNSETEINYFDNQRAKASGNIGEGEYISRNIDIESTAEIIFYDTETTEVQVSGDNELNAILNSPFIS